MLVRGPAAVLDDFGEPVPTRAGTFAVCRCGRSRTWPTCDGTHRFVTAD
jgi:CDGSH-type Zn-finger protein